MLEYYQQVEFICSDMSIVLLPASHAMLVHHFPTTKYLWLVRYKLVELKGNVVFVVTHITQIVDDSIKAESFIMVFNYK